MSSLFNRVWLLKKIQEELNKAQKNNNYRFAILCFDCDNFKLINYSLGHSTADILLREIPLRFQSSLPEDSFIARSGGDEFIIVLSDINDLEDAIAITQKIQREMLVPFQVQQREIFLNFSAGIVLNNQEYEEAEKLIISANLAMYQAKTLGKGQYQVYNKNMHARAMQRLQLEIDLHKGLKNQEFFLCYQPIICLKTGRISGFESLVRWQHPQLGIISPDRFIPIAEETGLIIPLGIWILQEACHQLKIWQQKYISALLLTMNVNVTVQQFVYDDLIEVVDRILEENNLSGDSLRLEITESAIMENNSIASQILEQFKERQIQICIDDFGTGYSSLSYLHQFPVDNLKIDRSFITRIQNTNQPHKIIEAIADLAHHFDMTVTAEGIETELQSQYLTDLNCEYGQGYYFAPPLSPEEIEVKYLLKSPVRLIST